ncbi:MAG: ribosomal-processing cysteine protease Prp [Spirochaetales bacterium]|uniref:Ribosomal processing cysteine protease Prp n=1 Tax=Candidatus Thalassospirochaeta sargassi TaxID=3119039 RepID=A0AAJ1IF85_9SPIO|nr:ribosomal-processing cysteine protease Prp [Spirochaetales bacterium]
MIDIMIAVDLNGNLRSIKSEGHSMSAAKGGNIICAAVSAQIRSVVRVLDKGTGCISRVKADQDGYLELSVEAGEGENRWLKGVTDVLVAGLLETERDYPDECSVKLIKLS